MLLRMRRSGLAFTIAVSLGSSVWAQLPSSQGLSPINRIGRAWGFGVGDGYHECTGGSCAAIKDSRLGFLDKLNPFDSTLYPSSCGVSTCPPPKAGSAALPMTSLPTSPYSSQYQAYALPVDTPMPGISPPVQSYGYPNMAAPAPVPPRMEPSYPPTVSPLPIPDPMPMNQPEISELRKDAEAWQSKRSSQAPKAEAISDPRSDSLLDDSQLDAEQVPPSPPLRRRQPGDKPLGEIPDNWKEPIEQQRRAPSDGGMKPDKGTLLNRDTGDSLDLLPANPSFSSNNYGYRHNPYGTVSYPTQAELQEQLMANQRAREAGYLNYLRANANPYYGHAANGVPYYSMPMMSPNRYR